MLKAYFFIDRTAELLHYKKDCLKNYQFGWFRLFWLDQPIYWLEAKQFIGFGTTNMIGMAK